MQTSFKIPQETVKEVNEIAKKNGLTAGNLIKALLFAIKTKNQELFFKFFTSQTKKEND